MMAEEKLNKSGDKRGLSKGGGKGNRITTKAEVSKEMTTRIMNEIIYNGSKPRITTDEECEERLAEYFMWCAESGVRPTVEEMSLSLGYTRKTIWEWEQGNAQSKHRSYLIKKAKEYMASFDAKVVVEGGMNPLVYFFRAKNYYGMKDVQDVVITPNASPLGDEANAEEIMKKLNGAKIIEVEEFKIDDEGN